MDRDEQGPELEEEIFKEISEEEEDETSLDAALLDEDEDEDEFVQGSVDAQDLATGFNATIPTREIDVDEDIQGDEVVQAGGEELLTELEVTGEANAVVRGDEIQLDLEDALTSGKTVTEAPEGD
jgi:phosphate starvation-inducible protein PhoH